MANYAKGEWYLELRPADNVRRVRCDSEVIADVFGTNAEDEANAHLIAASRELYEACKLMDTFIESWLDVLLSNMTSEELHQYHDVVKQAIAKVEGK